MLFRDFFVFFDVPISPPKGSCFVVSTHTVTLWHILRGILHFPICGIFGQSTRYFAGCQRIPACRKYEAYPTKCTSTNPRALYMPLSTMVWSINIFHQNVSITSGAGWRSVRLDTPKRVPLVEFICFDKLYISLRLVWDSGKHALSHDIDKVLSVWNVFFNKPQESEMQNAHLV